MFNNMVFVILNVYRHVDNNIYIYDMSSNKYSCLPSDLCADLSFQLTWVQQTFVGLSKVNCMFNVIRARRFRRKCVLEKKQLLFEYEIFQFDFTKTLQSVRRNSKCLEQLF